MSTSTANWLQAWGTLAGAVFAAAAAIAAFLVLVHEIKIRRRDEQDIRASTARSVLVTSGDPVGKWTTRDTDGQISSMELYMNNFSRSPVVDVAVSAERLDGGPRFGLWSTDLLIPGERRAKNWILDPPLHWPYSLDPPGLIRTRITFTDDNGLRWERIDREQPVRIFAANSAQQIGHDRPIWKLGNQSP
jgi:hypothetical protein